MSFSVTSYLATEHNLAVRPGAKCICPFCDHQTFSVKRDDSLAKCFHPKCGRYVAAHKAAPNRIGTVLDRVFEDFHGELLRLSTIEGRNAYRYCVTERAIHPKVVADSMLGSVPENYDVASVFAPFLHELKEAAYRDSRTGREPGSQNEAQSLAAEIDALELAQNKLKDLVEAYRGWLAFFYTDDRHNVVAIRFRRPYSKDIRMFKPTEAAGLFNREMYVPLQSEDTSLNSFLLVFEGEFNQLQLQSLMARVKEGEGLSAERGYVNACAIGGVNNADIETIRRVAEHPVICFDNDDAGPVLVESARKAMSGKAFTTPKPFKDMDEYIRSFGGDSLSAYSSVQQLIARMQPFCRGFDAVKSEIDNIRRSEGRKDGLKSFEANRKVAELIIADLSDRARLYHDNRLAYLFLFAEKQLIAIERGDWHLDWLLARYGIASTERIADQVTASLRLEAFTNGLRTEVYPFSHYRKESNTLYVSNLAQQVYRITAQETQLVDNGTDGVLFRHSPSWEPFELLTEETESCGLDSLLFAEMSFESNALTPDECRLVILLFVFAMFFPELFPTRPMLALIGECGSGKTFALERIGTLLFGSRFKVTTLSDDAKDLDAAVTNNPFVVVDNADRPISWLEDKLAVIATGGSIKRRELYTTNREVEFPVRAFVAITSRTPHFRREDVADRLLPLRLGRLESFDPAAVLRARICEERNRALTELFAYLQDVVRALGEQASTVHRSKFRMADFADFALKLAYPLGIGEQMSAILGRLSQQQSALATEDEPIFELLQCWLDGDSGRNVGRQISSADLCKDLARIAFVRGIEFPYSGNAKAFGKKLANLKATLHNTFGLSERTGHAGAKLLTFVPNQGNHRTAGSYQPRDVADQQAVTLVSL